MPERIAGSQGRLDAEALGPSLDSIVLGATALQKLRLLGVNPASWKLPESEKALILSSKLRLTISSSPASVLAIKDTENLSGAHLIMADLVVLENKSLTPDEFVAMLLHEIGHVVNRPPTLSQPTTPEEYALYINRGQREEFAADDYACRCGYGASVASGLQVLQFADPQHFQTRLIDDRIARIAGSDGLSGIRLDSASYRREFSTIDVLLGSRLETRGVDAFALCIIKMERQLRRLFTFSIFQFPCFADVSIQDLKTTLVGERIYFEGFIKGFEMLHPVTIADLIGSEYSRLCPSLAVVTKHRNKIFHGQTTGHELSRDALLGYVSDLQQWCRLLGEGARNYLGYEGFDDSFRKAADPKFVSSYKRSLTSIADYKVFLLELHR